MSRSWCEKHVTTFESLGGCPDCRAEQREQREREEEARQNWAEDIEVAERYEYYTSSGDAVAVAPVPPPSAIDDGLPDMSDGHDPDEDTLPMFSWPC